MSYSYDKRRPELFTDTGQRVFLNVRDLVQAYIEQAGAVLADRVIRKISGDGWTVLACLDRMVELGEIQEVHQPGVAGQHRVFVGGKF